MIIVRASEKGDREGERERERDRTTTTAQKINKDADPEIKMRLSVINTLSS